MSVRNRKLRNTRSDRRSRDPLWKCPWGVLYDIRVLYSAWLPELSTRVLYLAWLPVTIHPRPIFSVVTGTSPDYLPLLFSYSVYIGCVVLQGCLRSHCGIYKSQMVNLIPTCIVSSKKNYFRMILLNSEKQCIGSCATPVVTPSEVSIGCSLRRPRPIFSMVTGISPGYLPLLFSYSI